MRLHPMLFVTFLGLVSCGGPDAEQACADYLAAANGCLSAAEAPLLDQTTICAPYADLRGDAAQAVVDTFTCPTQAYATGDCSSSDGYADVSEAVLECSGVDMGDADTDADSDSDTDADSDSDADADVVIEDVEFDCGGGGWDYTVTTSSANHSGALLYITDDSSMPWEESHDLLDASTTLSLALDTVSDPGDQQANQSTYYDCDMESQMIWKVSLYDAADYMNEIHCVVFSGSATDPSVVFGGGLEGCDEI